MSQVPCARTRDFFEEGTPEQFEWVLGMYDKCLRIKAEHKSKKPDNIVTLDKWYQNELPKKIKSRGKDPHLTHEELVQTIKWKLARGKFRPNLVNLVQMNTPRVVMQETKKAFRCIFKHEDLQRALTAMCNLKGVGPAMASAVLAAGAPQVAPFMADEVLLALPEVDCLDYTMKEYMRMTEHVNTCVERLNSKEGGDKWTPHRVELAVWTHYIATELKPELLEEKPSSNSSSKPAPAAENGDGGTDSAAVAPKEAPAEKAEERKPEESKGEAAAVEEGEKKETVAAENGTSNGGSGANHDNGKSEEEEAHAQNGAMEVKTNGDSPAVAAAESDENTNDSTKENKESSAQKRPHEEDSNGSAAAAVANTETEAAVAGEGEDEPAAKKLKEQQQPEPAAPPPVAAEALTTA